MEHAHLVIGMYLKRTTIPSIVNLMKFQHTCNYNQDHPNHEVINSTSINKGTPHHYQSKTITQEPLSSQQVK